MRCPAAHAGSAVPGPGVAPQCPGAQGTAVLAALGAQRPHCELSLPGSGQGASRAAAGVRNSANSSQGALIFRAVSLQSLFSEL